MLTAIAMASFAVKAQKLDASKVPHIVKQAFEKKYPCTAVTWEKEDQNFEAGFKKDGKTMSAVIEPNGNIGEIETDIAIKELPAAVLSYVKEHYAGKSIKEGAMITKADGTVTYEAEVAHNDLIFDSNGKFIKEVKKDKEDKEDND